MRVIKFREFIEEADTVEWLIDGLLPNTGWTTLTAPQGTGKTRLMLQMCDALERGVPFLGLPTIKTKCLFVQMDSTPLEWREIVRQVIPHSHSLTVVDVPAFWLDNVNGKYVEWFTNAVLKIKPGYVVFDSLYKLCSDINSPNAVGPRISQIKQMLRVNEVDTPWMVLHHPPQNETRAAGSRSIVADASYNWELSPTQLNVTKGRLREKGTLALEMDDKGIWHSYGDVQESGGGEDALMDGLIHDPLI